MPRPLVSGDPRWPVRWMRHATSASASSPSRAGRSTTSSSSRPSGRGPGRGIGRCPRSSPAAACSTRRRSPGWKTRSRGTRGLRGAGSRPGPPPPSDRTGPTAPSRPRPSTTPDGLATRRPAPAQADPAGPTVAGQRFHILRHHSRGGLGEVFLAFDGELNRPVALKELPARRAHDPDSQARFLREAEVTGRLEHPGIVPIYSMGRHEDGRPYYAMRFIEGETLRDAIERYHRGKGATHRRRRPGSGLSTAPAERHRHVQRGRLRPQPGGRPPRPEARERHARPVRRDPRRRLGGRQVAPGPPGRRGRAGPVVRGPGGRVDDPARLGDRDAPVHEPRAGDGRPGAGRAGERHLQPGGDPVLPARRACPLPGRRHAERPGPRLPRHLPRPSPVAPIRRSDARGDLLEGDVPGPARPSRDGPRPGQRPRGLAGGRPLPRRAGARPGPGESFADPALPRAGARPASTGRRTPRGCSGWPAPSRTPPPSRRSWSASSGRACAAGTRGRS